MTAKHFYGSSVAEWKTSTNLMDIINHFRKDDLIYNLWIVPLPHESSYEIEWYQPKVEGAEFLGSFKKMEPIKDITE